jgi:hypothetical protein
MTIQQQQTARDLDRAVEIAYQMRFSAEHERCPSVRDFYELRGLHQRGRIGDCMLAAALRRAAAGAAQNLEAVPH